MKRIALLGLALFLPATLMTTLPVRAEETAPKEAQDAVEATRKAYAEYKSAQESANKIRTEALKGYREAEEGAAKDAAYAKYLQVNDAENAKVRKASDVFVDALEAVGADSFDVEKDAALLEFGLLSWAERAGEKEPKRAVEIYELFLKKLPKSMLAPFIRTNYLPNALLSTGDFEAAAKRIGELAKECEEKYAPSLNALLADIKAIAGDIEGAQKGYAEVIASIPEKLERNDPRASLKRYIEPKVALVGKMAPEINSKTWLGGEARPLSELKGNVVLVDIWATWCGPCKAAMPGLDTLHKKYASKGFSVLGVTQFFSNGSLPATEGDMKARLTKTTPVKDLTEKTFLEHMKTFHERAQSSYPYVVANKEEIESFKVPGYPTLYILDKQGRVVYVQVGGGRDKVLEAVIERQLAAK